jgi:hypothetical protein
LTSPGELSPADKAFFLRIWNLTENDITEDEILMAIKLGHF